MAKRAAGLTLKKKRGPQDATRTHDVDPIRRRVEALEAWASTLFNPDTPPKNFNRRQVPR